MCGIAGFCQNNGELSDVDLNKMTDTLRRRGPDDSGSFVNTSVGLGMRRLSIIDIEHGQQPVYSQSGRFVLVFNGEIYNYKALRDELTERGYNFQSQGDAEVIVNLFEHEGLEALNRLRGMFAIAIWDKNNDELFLIRDQLGIKPIFYSLDNESLIFGSEIKALLEVLPEKLDINGQALDALFAYTYIPAPLTIWKDIHKLKPGHYLKWHKGKVEEHKYWDLLYSLDGPTPSISDLQDNIDDTVQAHLTSDVEVGAFLSGGIDSSSIVVRMQHQLSLPIQALSVKFKSKSHLFDETTYAQELQKLHGFDLHVHSLDPTEYSSTQEAILAFDEPFSDDSIVPSMAISELASKRLKVVMSGAGGDEIFGGYNRYQGVALHEIITKLPRFIRKFILSPVIKFAGKIIGYGSRRGDLLRRFAEGLPASTDDAYMGYITASSPLIRRELLATCVLKQVDMERTRELVREHQTRGARLDPVKRAMYVDFNTYLPEDVLALSDRIGMWHSLEIRTPLADRLLAELAFRLPAKDLVSSRNKKIAFRLAVSSWLPESFLSHPKQGFEGPTASWLRGPGERHIREAMEKDTANAQSLVNHSALERFLQEHIEGKADHAKRLFTAFTVMKWTSIYSHRIGKIG
ncbi:MAG: asparagine synthase (glutamine-hydrolyzing) [Marinobacter sp.]|nr:asparagine synthase (glutamine-hydrolyzing) [Marinobacter sp.]